MLQRTCILLINFEIFFFKVNSDRALFKRAKELFCWANHKSARNTSHFIDNNFFFLHRLLSLEWVLTWPLGFLTHFLLFLDAKVCSKKKKIKKRILIPTAPHSVIYSIISILRLTSDYKDQKPFCFKSVNGVSREDKANCIVLEIDIYHHHVHL